MLRPPADPPPAIAEAARLYALAVIYAAAGSAMWFLAGRRLARPRKEI